MFICVYIYIYMCICIYIYIYIEREREIINNEHTAISRALLASRRTHAFFKGGEECSELHRPELLDK